MTEDEVKNELIKLIGGESDYFLVLRILTYASLYLRANYGGAGSDAEMIISELIEHLILNK